MFTSDHGIGLPGAKWTARKAGLEIPFIAYQPNTVYSGGKVFTELMSNVDVLPTLIDYLGREIPANMQGCSFLPLLRGETTEPPRREVFGQYTPDMKREVVDFIVEHNPGHPEHGNEKIFDGQTDTRWLVMEKNASPHTSG